MVLETRSNISCRVSPLCFLGRLVDRLVIKWFFQAILWRIVKLSMQSPLNNPFELSVLPQGSVELGLLTDSVGGFIPG